MSPFYITDEGTEDTFAATDSFDEAIRLAREAASEGHAGDLVTILECGGKAVKQFIRMPDGTVAEQPIARQVEHGTPATGQTVGIESEPYRPAPNRAPDSGRNPGVS
jgi:hypothetical protein